LTGVNDATSGHTRAIGKSAPDESGAIDATENATPPARIGPDGKFVSCFQ
jgi:hypothetical protein